MKLTLPPHALGTSKSIGLWMWGEGAAAVWGLLLLSA